MVHNQTLNLLTPPLFSVILKDDYLSPSSEVNVFPSSEFGLVQLSMNSLYRAFAILSSVSVDQLKASDHSRHINKEDQCAKAFASSKDMEQRKPKL